jgi:hypothetical protein
MSCPRSNRSLRRSSFSTHHMIPLMCLGVRHAR